MAKKVCVFLADGFEEIEGLTVVDLLRRAGIEVTTASIMGDLMIHGSHGINVKADTSFTDVNFEEMDMVVLPGGLRGMQNLKAHAGVRDVLLDYDKKGKWIAAVCASPTVFGAFGLLNGRKATCYPGMEGELTGADYVVEPVVIDSHVMTSRGMGTTIDFALAQIRVLLGEEKAVEIGRQIVYLP